MLKEYVIAVLFLCVFSTRDFGQFAIQLYSGESNIREPNDG